MKGLKSLIFYSLIILTLFFSFQTIAFARKGCCSHHGGVSHCDKATGQYVCRDGSYSPTCGCSRN